MIHPTELDGLEEALPRNHDPVCECRHVSFADFLRLFDADVQPRILEAAKQDGVTHVVCMDNLDMWSSAFGTRTALIVGSKQTFTLAQVLQTSHFKIGATPSRFQFPVAYADPFRKEDNEGV